MDPACSSTRRTSPCSPAFRKGLYYPLPSGTSYLAIAIAADSESAAPPREMTGSPNSALREERTSVASADALYDSSTGSARMNVPVSRCCSSGGGARTPRPPRGVGPTRGYGVCQRSRDATLSAGSFSTSVLRTLTLTLTP